MTRNVEPQNFESSSMTWSAELARSIAGQRQRMKALSQGHELRIQNLAQAVHDAIEGLRDGEPQHTHDDRHASHRAEPSYGDPSYSDRTYADRFHVDELIAEPKPAAPKAAEPKAAAPAKSPVSKPAPAPKKAVAERVSANDWEAYKRQMLETLDAESEAEQEVEPEVTEERLTIEGTIRITDEMVAERDQEIARLNHLLETYQQNTAKELIGSYEAAFSMDELIVDQRKRLAEAEVALMEKRRLAEVELSQQRAKLARELADLEESRRQIEAEKVQLGLSRSESRSSDAPPSGKPPRRWLARLGLKESDTGENDGRQ